MAAANELAPRHGLAVVARARPVLPRGAGACARAQVIGLRLAARCFLFRELRLQWWRYWEQRLDPLHPGHLELRLLILDLEATR
jgi:hypothetical protein